jgi:putative membrane protein
MSDKYVVSRLSMEQQKETPSQRELIVLLVLYLIVFGLLAINPHDRADWALENLFPLGQLAAVIISYRYFKFTRLSYYMIFFYLLVQSWGGHFTYAEAAPFNWVRDHFHLTRNHYDRVAHFMLGFLVAIPIREILDQVVSTSRRWLAFLTAAIVLAIGAFYELIEWWVAVLATPNLGDKFLGTQGDIWDTQWDMFLALVGAVVTLALFQRLHDRQLRATGKSDQLRFEAYTALDSDKCRIRGSPSKTGSAFINVR